MTHTPATATINLCHNCGADQHGWSKVRDAAPDLLEAAEATLAYLQTLLPVTMSTSVCILLLEEAIAKAKGE